MRSSFGRACTAQLAALAAGILLAGPMAVPASAASGPAPAPVRPAPHAPAPHAPAPHAPAPHAAAPGAPVLVDCTNHARVQPRQFVLTCADGNDYLSRMRWAAWTSHAFGAGLERINDCVPSCAKGTFRSYPVLVTLWRPRPLAGAHTLHFTRLTTVFSGKRPVSAGKTITVRTWTLWSHI